MSAVQELETKALALSKQDRVHLAEALLASLPLEDICSESDDLAEVERREREIESGVVEPLSESDFWVQG